MFEREFDEKSRLLPVCVRFRRLQSDQTALIKLIPALISAKQRKASHVVISISIHCAFNSSAQ